MPGLANMLVLDYLNNNKKQKQKQIVKYKNKLMFYIDPGKRIFNKVQKFKTFLSLIL